MLLVDDMLSNDSYPEGHAIRNGEPDARKDIWFREGPREETAVGSTSWSRIKALYR